MKTFFAPAACAAAILLSSVSVDAILAPAAAQEDVSFDSFHDYLANYGDWVYSDRWGEVWVPENVPDDFQPYGTNGYWAATDNYGWVWVSNYEWGDVPFHYGRWVNDPDNGWLWIPGYVWSPAWVVWRHNGDYTGWMPMPPDPEFLGQGGPSIGIGLNIGGGIHIGIDFNDTNSYYGYSQWYPGYNADRFARNWVFVGTGHLADHDFNRYWAPRGNNVTIIHNTTNITNYTVVNNYIVNRGVDVNVVQRASGRPVQRVALTQVIKRPQFVAQASAGMQIQQHQRQINPRGDGRPNSAPAPSQKIVQGLSNNVPQHAGHAPMHVFTKTTVTQAPAFKGKIAPATGGAEPGAMHGPGGGPGGAMNGPNGHTQEEKFNQKPAETGGPGTRGPGGAMTGPGNAPGGTMNGSQEHKMHETTPGGAMTGPGGGTMNGPEEHKAHETTPGGTMTGPGGTPQEDRHRTHETSPTGGAMTGPGGGMNAPTTPMERHATPPESAPTSSPMMHRHETPPANAAPGGGGERNFERRPVTTAPSEQNAAPRAHPVEKAPPPPPPQKPEEKDKKDKPHG